MAAPHLRSPGSDGLLIDIGANPPAKPLAFHVRASGDALRSPGRKDSLVARAARPMGEPGAGLRW
jgi:hypothetical protein